MIWSTAERRCNRHHYFRWRGNISSRYTRQWLLVTSGSFDEQACPTFHTIFQDIGAGCVDVGMTTRKDYRRTIAFVEVIKENNTNERCWWCRHFCEKWTVCGLVSFLRRFRCGTSNGNISGWSPEGVAKIGIIMKYIQHKQLYKFFRLICRTSNCVLPDAMTKIYISTISICARYWVPGRSLCGTRIHVPRPVRACRRGADICSSTVPPPGDLLWGLRPPNSVYIWPLWACIWGWIGVSFGGVLVLYPLWLGARAQGRSW